MVVLMSAIAFLCLFYEQLCDAKGGDTSSTVASFFWCGDFRDVPVTVPLCCFFSCAGALWKAWESTRKQSWFFKRGSCSWTAT